MLVYSVTTVLFICFKLILSEDVICAISGKKSVNTVDDRFLSMSIDPAALITGINAKTPIFSYTSLILAQHLSPSFVRIAGPSTEFLSYSRDLLENDVTAGMTITTSMWQSMNDWFKMANLTLVFAINDNEKVNGAWNPKSFYPLLDLSDKLDIICLWQLGFDSSCKTLPQYKEDLLTLKHIVDTFPSKKQDWKIVGGDISGYVYNVSNARQLLQSLRGHIDYFMYENASLESSEEFPDMSMRSRLLPKGNFKIWTTAPKSQHAVTFSSALEWARQIGDAARGGFSVVFRQPRLHEFFVDTPTYWVSLLHKHLMGKKVLEVKFSQEKKLNLQVYAHCTRKQNDFSKLGAITIMAINNETTPNVLALKIGTGSIKKIMINSYVLTTTEENSVNTFLNGKKLSMEMLEENEKLKFTPKLRRAHITKFLSLPLQPKSIGFFVLPGARIPVCINEEYNMKLLMQEIYEDQNVKFASEESDESYEPSNFTVDEIDQEDDPVNFNEIFKQIEEELENDEQYYKSFQYKTEFSTIETTTPEMKDFKREIKQKRRIKPKRLLTLDLEINNEEMQNFLKEKLKTRATKEGDATLTSEEIDKEAERIAKKVTNSIMRRTPKRYTAEIKNPLRDTRDINMELIRTRADHYRPHPNYHRHKNDEEQSSMYIPKIASRRNEDTMHRHSSLYHNQNNMHASSRHHLRSQSKFQNSKHSSLLHRAHRLKGKRNSKEGLQDAFKFLEENADASEAEQDANFNKDSVKPANFWGVERFERPNQDEENVENDLDYTLPNGNIMDYPDYDYDFDYEVFSADDSPFIRRKRYAQQGNNVMQEKYHFIFGKPVDPSKIHINPRQKEHQLRLLRQRLSRRKKLENLQRKVKPIIDITTQEPKVTVNGKRPFTRTKRSALELSLQARYKKYIPKTQHLKQWKPSDILKIRKDEVKYKRSIDSSENQIENEITHPANKMDSNLNYVNTAQTQLTTNNNDDVATSTVVSIENTESLSNCVTNEECLNLIIGTSLDPEEFLKPGWASHMYKRVVDFLAKIQKDVLQVMTS